MCGVTGFLRAGNGDAAAIGRRMADALVSRGPDDAGVWHDAAAGVVLAHRRLAVLDRSPAGHQPMHSASGRFVIAFNGEIYNHLALREVLGDMTWRGHSDTETLLCAFEAWGIEKTLQQLVGMFAIVLWDSLKRELTLARDRIGEKPLYYGWQGGVFLFGSELKALAEHPAWRPELDRDALALYMRYGYIPVPRTIWRGVWKLLPGSIVTVAADAANATSLAATFYWRASDLAGSRVVRRALADHDAADELETMIRRSLAGQMIADVPVGAFLSGGVDSSAIVALMQSQATRPVRTFSIGFHEADYDEAVHARAIAAHLGTEHTEVYLTSADAMAVIPRLAAMYDEPFGDSSQIPTHLVAAMARQNVTVCLSGDGGDELFGGYNRYFLGRSLWRKFGLCPRSLRVVAGRLLTVLEPEQWDLLSVYLPPRWRVPALGDKLYKLASVIDAGTPEELYRSLVSQHRESGSVVIDGREPPLWADAETARFVSSDFAERMMFHDQVGYLPDDILVKVDRAAMAVSLETRIPLLDHRLVEFAWSLPLDMKIRNGQSKWLLRQVLFRYVPQEMIDRPKQGFSLPLDSWLRGPLREWAEALLDESRLRREGYLHPAPVRRRWQEHLNGKRNWQHWLWNVLMFQAWRERWQ